MTETLRSVKAWHTRTKTFLQVGVCCVLFCSALALGGVHLPVHIALCLALCLLVWMGVVAQQPVALGISDFPIVIGIIVCTLQLLPLPQALANLISPKATWLHQKIWQDASSWVSISQDRFATCDRLLVLIAFLHAAFLARTLYVHRQQKKILLSTLVLIGVALVLLGTAQYFLGYGRPYNSYGTAHGVFVSSFVNPNHFGGFLALATCCSLGLFTLQEGAKRWMWVIASVVCMLGVVLTQSRGAVASVMMGCFLYLMLYRSRIALIVLSLVIAGVGSAVLSMQVLVNQSVADWKDILIGHQISKAEIWSLFKPIMSDHLMLGIGNGALSLVAPRYIVANSEMTVTHFENEIMQVLVDDGILFGTCIIILVAWTFYKCMIMARGRPMTSSMVAGIATIGFHNLADFNLDAMAVGIPIVIMWTATANSSRTSTIRRLDAIFAPLKIWQLLGLQLLTIAAAVAAIALAPEQLSKKMVATFNSQAPQVSQEAVLDVLKESPADAYFTLAASREAQRRGDFQFALNLANKGQLLAPHSALGNLYAARALFSMGYVQQALSQFAEAVKNDASQFQPIIKEVWEKTAWPEDLERIAGGDTGLIRQLETFYFSKNNFSVALALCDKAYSQGTATAELLSCQVRALVRLGRNREALEKLDALLRVRPYGIGEYLTRADLLQNLGRINDAVEFLSSSVASVDAPLILLRHLYGLQMHYGRYKEASATVDRMGYYNEATLTVLSMQADIDERTGNITKALHLYERMVLLQPSLAYAGKVSQLREKLGDSEGAVNILEQTRSYILSLSNSDTTEIDKQIEALRIRTTERGRGR